MVGKHTVIGHTPDGGNITRDENGDIWEDFYTAPSKRNAKIANQERPDNDPNKNLSVTKNEAKDKEKNMAEVTELTLLKRDIDAQNEKVLGKVQNLEDKDKAIEKNLETLDSKMCTTDECRLEQDKIQTQKYNDLLDRLKKLEGPQYVCQKCGIGILRQGEKVCPHCGREVEW